jgi:hypothetical protein
VRITSIGVLIGTLAGAIFMVAMAMYVRFTVGEVSPRRVLLAGRVVMLLATVLVSWGERQRRVR